MLQIVATSVIIMHSTSKISDNSDIWCNLQHYLNVIAFYNIIKIYTVKPVHSGHRRDCALCQLWTGIHYGEFN